MNNHFNSRNVIGWLRRAILNCPLVKEHLISKGRNAKTLGDLPAE
jgi:hypothetical protein